LKSVTKPFTQEINVEYLIIKKRENRSHSEIPALLEVGYAQNNLGNCYYSGTGVEKNEQKAVEWYQKAVLQEANTRGNSRIVKTCLVNQLLKILCSALEVNNKLT